VHLQIALQPVGAGIAVGHRAMHGIQGQSVWQAKRAERAYHDLGNSLELAALAINVRGGGNRFQRNVQLGPHIRRPLPDRLRVKPRKIERV